MVAGTEHERLKLFGRTILKHMGILNIYEEYPVNCGNGYSYRVDLIGYFDKHNDEYKAVIIEVGDTPAERLTELRQKYSCVLHLPYKTFDNVVSESDRKILIPISNELNEYTQLMLVSRADFETRLQKYRSKLDEIDKTVIIALRQFKDIQDTTHDVQSVFASCSETFAKLARLTKSLTKNPYVFSKEIKQEEIK